jgi:hypothetical protein
VTAANDNVNGKTKMMKTQHKWKEHAQKLIEKKYEKIDDNEKDIIINSGKHNL